VKGDFSRESFRPQKHYSGVLQQQGRVQLDSDWNEQVEIDAHRDRMLAVDLIGPAAAPRQGGGFAVSASGEGDLRISPGRIYVAGTLCELAAETSYLTQPDLPRPPPISPEQGRTDLVYLDVWRRHITALEDPDIREPALGGADTTTRVRVVWQVKVLTGVGTAGCEEPIEGWPPAASDARLGVEIEGGYSPLENHLYRVEVHEGGGQGAASFKWSRDNGSVVCAVRELRPAGAGERSAALVERVGATRELGLEAGCWVEALGDQSELSGTAGTMALVEAVDEGERVVTLDGDILPHAEESHLKLRRWDQAGAALTITEGVLELEEGISIELSGSSFRSGDYWTFPARAAAEKVEWPPTPPGGIHHDYCRLALITWEKGADAAVTDCRRLFEPLPG
jgi:Family of unknown function (DUF6519)